MSSSILKLKQLHVENYHGVRDLTLNMDGKCTILYGINGAGKSTILQSIAQIFSHIITKVSSNQIKSQISFKKEDVRFGASELKIQGTVRFGDSSEETYMCSYKKGIRAVTQKENSAFFSAFTNQYLGENSSLPIFSDYAVNRIVQDIPVHVRTKQDSGVLSAYQNSIEQTNFRTFFEWFRNQEDIENQEKVEREDLEYTDPSLKAVRFAIMSIMPELTNIRIVRNPLRMCISKNGITLRVEQLSDGEKCLLAMMGDIARRLAIANPHSDDPLSGGGIVLIDEVGLHMHQVWQQKIVSTLHKTFPNIQFILTTHSPLVLGELDGDFGIFSLVPEENNVNVQKVSSTCYHAHFC